MVGSHGVALPYSQIQRVSIPEVKKRREDKIKGEANERKR